MHTLQINVLIQLLVSSTCYEHHEFIIRKTILHTHLIRYAFHAEITIKGYI